MPKKKEKPTKKSSQVSNNKQDPPGQDPVSDAEEEDPFDNPNLPSQEHCTWLLNVIKIHAKKIADECIKTSEAKTNSQIGQLKEEIQTLKKEKVKLQEVIEDMTKQQRKLQRLQHESNLIRSEVKDIKTKSDMLEQEQYQNNLQIVGLPEVKDNDEIKQLIKLSKEKLGVKIRSSDIKEVIRLGKRKEKGPPRNTIVKFQEKSTKVKLCEHKKKLAAQKDPVKNIYLNDHLTRQRQHLLYAARQLVKSKKLFGAWTQGGNILVKKEESGKIIQVFNHTDLMEIKDCNHRIDVGTKSELSSRDDSNTGISHISDYDYDIYSDY